MPKGEISAITTDELKAILEKLVRQVWRNKAMPAEIDKALAQFFASEFWKAVEEGYGLQLADLDFDTPNYAMLRKLEFDVFQFSSAKSYQQLKAISQALLNEEGKLRSFAQFRIAAAEVNNAFVNQWLQAEYQYAVASAQSAAQWQRIQATKETLPLLRYRTAGDERVRLEHQELEDVVRPVDDGFWDLYYPPNGWGCRCDVFQEDSSATITPLEKITLPDLKPIFKYNPGKRGFAFPPGHPYYDGLPEQVREQALQLWIDQRQDTNGDTE